MDRIVGHKSVMIRRCENTTLWDTCRFPRFSPSSHRGFSEIEGSNTRFTAAGEKTVCGACGYIERGWYDRKRR